MDAGKLQDSTKIAIVTHVFTRGPAHELECFLVDKCNKVAIIGHPFYSSTLKRSYYKIYKNGMSRESQSRFARKSPILDFAFDLIKTVTFILCQREKYDLYIGAGVLDAYAGLVLRSLSATKHVIFYSIDYVPKRFDNPFLNRVYHWLDGLCAARCDAVWNLSEKMIKEREKRGINISRNLQQVVPIGTDFDKIARLATDKIERRTLVYMGTLSEKQGLQLALESLPELSKKYQGLRLVVIGEGPFRPQLEEICRSNGISDIVEFVGEVRDNREMELMMSKCAAGVATYKPDPDNFAQFTDVGKPKYYAACGLPPIITKVPPIARAIEENDAGYVIQYEKDEFIGAVSRMIEDDGDYNRRRENAIRFASEFSWHSIFDNAFKDFFRFISDPESRY